jgi:hypothetical protein
MTGALHVSTDMVIIMCFENCCTSVNEYNQENYRNNIRSKRKQKTITSIKNKISENELTITKQTKGKLKAYPQQKNTNK